MKLFEIYQDEEKFVQLHEMRVLSDEAVTISDADCAASFVREKLSAGRLATEHVYVLCLSNACELLAVVFISAGSNRQAMVPVDKVFQAVLLTNATSLIVVHNHPSGDCTPSKFDKESTEHLVETGQLLGLPVLDHLIVSDKDFYSMGGKL